jgi:hypothetical protein
MNEKTKAKKKEKWNGEKELREYRKVNIREK